MCPPATRLVNPASDHPTGRGLIYTKPAPELGSWPKAPAVGGRGSGARSTGHPLGVPPAAVVQMWLLHSRSCAQSCSHTSLHPPPTIYTTQLHEHLLGVPPLAKFSNTKHSRAKTRERIWNARANACKRMQQRSPAMLQIDPGCARRQGLLRHAAGMVQNGCVANSAAPNKQNHHTDCAGLLQLSPTQCTVCRARGGKCSVVWPGVGTPHLISTLHGKN